MAREEIIGQIVKDFFDLEIDGVERDLDVPLDTNLRKAITIIGPRRAGKTFYLLSHFTHLRKEGKAALFLPLDDDRLYPPSIEDLSTLIKVFYELFPTADEKYLFLDEIQNVPNWELFVKRAVEREGFKVLLTGSSSKLLSKEIASALRGRTLTFEMFPFSFREFLRARGVKLSRYLSTREEAMVKALLKEYLEFGGFPEIVMIENEYLKRKVLEEYIDVMLYRDVVERYNLKNLKAVRMFLKLLVTSFAKEFSINRTANYMKSIGIEVSKNTLYNYLEYFTDADIVFPIKRFSYSLKETERSLPKIYVIDNGLINAYSLRFTSNIGRLMENTVFLELRRRNKEVFYFKTQDGREVDFVVREDGKIVELIQVSYSIDDASTWERELKGLVKASKELRCENLMIITWDREGKEEFKGMNVELIPLWKFLTER